MIPVLLRDAHVAGKPALPGGLPVLRPRATEPGDDENDRGGAGAQRRPTIIVTTSRSASARTHP
jgi:hypothetical protein